MLRALRSAPIAFGVFLLSAVARAEPAEPGQEACFAAYEGAQRLRNRRALLAARAELIQCGAASCPTAIRSDCVTWLSEVDALVPTLVFSVKSGNRELGAVRLWVDQKELPGALDGAAVRFDPGEHALRVEAEGHQTFEQTITAREGEKARPIVIELTPLPVADSEPAFSAPVIALAAVGAVGLASFGFFAIKSHSAKSDLDDCKGHCAADEVDAVRRDQIIADVSLGIGVVALGIAAYLHFGSSQSESRSAPSGWSLGVAPLPGGGGATLGRAW